MKRILPLLLCLTMFIQAAMPVYAGEEESPVSVYANDVAIDREILIKDSDMTQLQSYLQQDGDMAITICSDMDARIGNKGDKNAPHVDFWCTLGSGLKVIDLNGHNLTLYNDRERQSYSEGAMTMFKVPSGAELVINDSKNSGVINYSGRLTTDRKYHHERNLIEITGGKFTLNGGELSPGRSDKVYVNGIVRYRWRQVNGCSVVLNGGEAVFNGGIVRGRGLRWEKNISGNSFLDEYDKRNRAIEAVSGSLIINDGEFWGMGNANVLNISSGVDLKILGGYFDTHKLGYDITLEMSSMGAEDRSWYNVGSSYGSIGIPARETSRDMVNVKYLLDGKTMTQDEREQGAADADHKNVTVMPLNRSAYGVYYKTINDAQAVSYTGTQELKFNWDKKASLSFGIIDKPYFPLVRNIDKIKLHTYPENTVTISETPNGKGVNKTLTDFSTGSNNYLNSNGMFSDWDMVDLSKIPADALADLQEGKTYYVRLYSHERWSNQNTFDGVFSASMPIKLTITPAMPIPDYDLGFKYETDDSGRMRIYGTKDGESKFINNQKQLNIIDDFEGKFAYTNASGASAYSTFKYGNFAQMETYDFRHGESNVTYSLTAYKDGKSKTASYTDKVIYYPTITTSPAMDSSSRVLIDANATSKTVTLNSNANNTTNIFWAKDGVKISGSAGKKTWPVALTSSDSFGWYSLGYTVDGKDCFGKQSVYLGIKEGSRTVVLSRSSSYCTIEDNSSTTPTITISSMQGSWGAFERCKWHLVSYPEGYSGAINKSGTTKTMTFDAILGKTNYKSDILEGTYQISCTVYDNYGQSATSAPVSIYVTRYPTGAKLHLDPSFYSDSSGNGLDITDKFVVLYNELGEKPTRIYPEFLPENSVDSNDDEIFYESSNGSIVQTDDYGNLYGKKSGSAAVTAGYGTAEAKTTVYVPKTKYDIPVYEDWLDVKAGGTVHRGKVYEDNEFLAELSWEAKSRSGSSTVEYTADTFVGNLEYSPVLNIYPKAGVCYPVIIDVGYNTYYDIDTNRFSISVNGKEYYNQVYSARNYFAEAAPLSEGIKNEDKLSISLDSTGLITDPKDDYLNKVVYSVDIPKAGQDKKASDSEYYLLDTDIATDGIFMVGDNVVHITDKSTVDGDISNDKTEDFETYEPGETYRYYVWFGLESSYTNESGGKLYFADDVKAMETEHLTVTNNENANIGSLFAYCYFTITDDITIGDVNLDDIVNDADAKLYLKYLSGAYNFDSAQIRRADVNSDNKYDMLDVIAILNSR